MRVQLCGRMCVQGDDGVMIDSSVFPGRQGRIVFAYLVSAAQPVPREVLADLLWPERLPDAWRRDLAAVVSKLRALLARLGLDATAVLRGGGDSYELVVSPRPEVDADAAVAWLAESESALRRGDLGGALQAAQSVAGVARRAFLPGEAGDITGLIRERGAGSAMMAGHDWGGSIAWALAMNHPEVVDRSRPARQADFAQQSALRHQPTEVPAVGPGVLTPAALGTG